MAYLGEEIKKLGFGLMRLPQKSEGVIDVEQTKVMVDKFMEAGFTYFDTAWAYAGSEDAIREALVERYPREKYQLATKMAAWINCKTRDEALAQFKTSLERTKAGYFDFYLLHNLGEHRTKYFDEYGLWDWIREQKEAGLIKHAGFSFHSTPEELEAILREHPEMEFYPRTFIFGAKAAAGGVLAAIGIAMQKGIARGIFSNEAGLGSAPIAAAAAKTNEPVRQGLVTMTGTFIDTIIVCTLTGLSIVMMGSYQVKGIEGVQVTTDAFKKGLSFLPAEVSAFILMVCLVFFAFTTIIGWNYYGERCMYYLKGLKAVKIYKIVFITFITIGPFMSLEFIFVLADIVNGCMAIPNLIGLIGLRKEIVAETEKYFEYEQPVELVTNIEG